MDSTTDNCFILRLLAQRSRAEGHEKSQLPQETMLEVLLWLDRYDLDGKQITSRRLRFLVENNQMPFRTVCSVYFLQSFMDRLMLSIDPLVDEEEEPHEIHLYIETDEDVQEPVLYLSSCYVPFFSVTQHHARMLYACPSRRAIITAPALIRQLTFQDCDFGNGEEDTLGETLRVGWSPTSYWSRFGSAAATSSTSAPYNASVDEKTEVTEEGILSYLFTLPVPDCRFLQIECVNITPSFFKKLVQASKNSKLTCNVQLWLYKLRFDVSNLDIGVPPSRSPAARSRPEYRYSIADHGNGIRLVIHFTSYDGEQWDVTVRHGKKDREHPHCNFFGPEPEEEEQHEEVSP
ncbi:hypothetical protein AAVH_21689 [Aphelenchoides avenae]|nr:hypothetical protein AAVH_21689 [Aphelenchus avenae]